MNNIKFVLLVEVYRFGMYVGFFFPHYLGTNYQVSSICYKTIYFPCISFIVYSYKNVSGESVTLN
jgi:hypothetical protein